MAENGVLTVGVCPCWDLTCVVDGIAWGDHKRMVSQRLVPAGKTLNISRALNWLGIGSTAAGLWGEADYPAMLEQLKAAYPLIRPALTVTAGRTRTNVTVADAVHRREMHLRADCELATDASLQRLGEDLARLPAAEAVVFAGSMPEHQLEACASLVRQARDRGSRVAVDTSGAALKRMVREGGLYLIKPNLEELGELLGRHVENDAGSIISAGRALCRAVEIVLVSRGADGAIAITNDAAVGCRAAGQDSAVVHTVGCGDYLLAGFLSQSVGGDLQSALARGVKIATARARGLTETADAEHACAGFQIETTVY